MAKENGKKKQEGLAAYFKSLTIENIKCFKGKHTIDLSDGEGKPAQWTVILGNNNTGKTTLLKCLIGLQPTQIKNIFKNNHNENEYFPRGWTEFRYDDASVFKISAIIEYSQGLLFKEINKRQEDIGYWIEYSQQYNDFVNFFKYPKAPALAGFNFQSYGTSRKISRNAIVENEENIPHTNFLEDEDIPNVEDWLLNLFVAEKLGKSEAKNSLDLALNVLTSGILPDVQEARLSSQEKGAGFENFVEFRTDYGWIRLHDLGYGYQTMIGWVLDLVKRMVERYSDSPDPLAEPAIVLVDEIDLHLHPDWQRRIVAHLTKYFPNTQFIVTAHSPLIVQSAEEVNLVILKKVEDHVTIDQPKIRSFKGWTVEEILTDLMELEGQTMSNTYLELMQQFDEALDEDNYEKAKDAYDQLDKILHPTSSQRKLMKIQMTSLSPAETV